MPLKVTWNYQIFPILCFLGVKLAIVAKPQIPNNIPFRDTMYEPYEVFWRVSHMAGTTSYSQCTHPNSDMYHVSIYFIFDFRLAPVLIREITRRVNCKGTFQAVYTAGVVLPKPVATCRYWHRSSSSHVFTIPDFLFTKFCFVFLQIRSFLLKMLM